MGIPFPSSIWDSSLRVGLLKENSVSTFQYHLSAEDFEVIKVNVQVGVASGSGDKS